MEHVVSHMAIGSDQAIWVDQHNQAVQFQGGLPHSKRGNEELPSGCG